MISALDALFGDLTVTVMVLTIVYFASSVYGHLYENLIRRMWDL